MTLRGKADFDYGNTRLRARRGQLLTDADYTRLLGEDIDGLLTDLESRNYTTELGTVRHQSPLRALHSAVRAHLGRSLEDMRSFYAGRARELVDLLLARFDVQNLVSVLRARSRAGTTPEEAVAALSPVGWLAEPFTREILRAQELAGVVDLLARSAPARRQGATLRAAFREYERTGDLAGLERAVMSEHADRVATALTSPGPEGAALLRFVQREIDEHNLLVALRLRDAISSGAHDTPPPAETLLAGGAIPPATLAAAVQEPAPADIARTLGPLGGGTWQPGLQRWVSNGDLDALQRTLERVAITDTITLFLSGDPLAIDVPLAFTTAVQVEARNLRLLGEASVRGIARDVVRSELFWQKEPA